MHKWFAVVAFALVPMIALGVTVEGNSYPATVTIEGKTLKLIGAGLREKWWVDVYTMGVYTESGSCAASDMINRDEPKYLRLDMKRDVSAEKMSSTIGESFGDHMPKNASAELRQQRKTFESYFKAECTEGTRLEFFYQPGVGTSLKQNGKEMGPPLTGADFAKVLWDIYFGEESCCDDLKQQVLKTCKGN
jgi:hypothetical protein